jgi:hypothetical protein
MGIPNAERVQPVKWESTAEGGGEDDLFPTGCDPTEDACEWRGVYFQPDGGPRDEEVWAARDGDDLEFRDKNNTTPLTLSDLVAGAGGLTVEGHKVLRQLIHFIEDGPAEGFTSGAYREITGTAFPTAIVWWESSSKLKKIVERLLTWTGVNLTTDKWKVYDTDGSTVLWTVSDAISYSGVFETSRTRTITSGDA